ncbi:MAG: TraR/DksA C4-type zinc finger protein [Chloroflexota bacterium]
MVSKQVEQELRKELLQTRQRLESEIARINSSGTRADTFNDDEMTDNVDQHPADAGTELFEREKNLTLERTLQGTLQLVNEALHRMDEGTYGICEDCGAEIPEARLRAAPEAATCISCQAKRDRAEAG